jgi:hypothetical protein
LLTLSVMAATLIWVTVHLLQEKPPEKPHHQIISVPVSGGSDVSGRPVATLGVHGGGMTVETSGINQPVSISAVPGPVKVVRQNSAGRVTTLWAQASATPTVTGTSDGNARVTVTGEPVTITLMEPDPSRIGLIVGTMPGVVAVDVQLVRGRPLTPLGLDMMVSLDAQANLQQAGLGLAVGDKAFATVGGNYTWDGQGVGWYAAGGLRF